MKKNNRKREQRDRQVRGKNERQNVICGKVEIPPTLDVRKR